MCEHAGQQLHSLFGQLALGDVDAAANETGKHPLGIVARHTVEGHPAVLAISTAQPVVHMERLACHECQPKHLTGVQHIVRVNGLHPLTGDLLFEGAPGEVEPHLVEVIEPPVGPRHPHQGRRVVGQHLEPGFGLIERGLTLRQGLQQVVEAADQRTHLVLALNAQRHDRFV